MKISCHVSGFLEIADKAVILFCVKSNGIKNELLKKIDLLSGGALRDMYESGEFDGSAGSEVVLHRLPESAAGRIILVGLGEIRRGEYDLFRRAAGRAGALALKYKLESVSLYYDGADVKEIAQALVEGFVLGSYRYLDYKTDEKVKKNAVKSLALVIPHKAQKRAAETGIAKAEITTWAVTLCRDLTGMPGNDLYPETFVRQAQKASKGAGINCRVLGPAEIKKEKMGALEAVAKGSHRPPQFLIMEYKGKPGGKPIVLIGKGITFDTGGISLKPAVDMGEMKGDMMGAAVVLSVIGAAARLKAKANLTVLIPLAENMPSGHAARPGDIITSRAGHTIEIISTDAEGRLILADALDFADSFKPQAVIDIATLTGAAIYVLGYSGAPFVGTSKRLNDKLRTASANTGEKIWELPLWPEFADLMKSSIADLKNSGGKPAGTLTAASFLRKFVKNWPWLHIDIAYCDMEKRGQPYIPEGPTGYGVRLLLDLILNWK